MDATHENENEDSSIIIIIPEDVIKEILLRLPPKSLLRFKAVSKSWHALISSPSFVYRHLDFIDNISNGLHLINFSMMESREPALQAALLADDGKILDLEGAPPSLSRELVGEESDDTYIPLFGPVNGIYCIGIGSTYFDLGTFILWNPGNRHFLVLPPNPIPLNTEGVHFCSGFGFDYSNNDYKLFQISRHGSYARSPDRFSYFHLYSLATISWKCLDPFKICNDPQLIKVREDGRADFLPLMFHMHGIYLNGASHWLCTMQECSEPQGILSFNFGTQLLRLFSPLPQGVVDNPITNFSMPVDGCLSLVCSNNTALCLLPCIFDVYLMREYGVQESWTRAYTVTLNSFQARFIGIVDHQLFVCEHDHLSRVLSYCLLATRPEQEYYPVYNYPYWDLQILPYSGSLVPIKPCDELVKKKKKKKKKQKQR